MAMTLERVAHALRSTEGEDLPFVDANGMISYVSLSELADAIDTHLSAQAKVRVTDDWLGEMMKCAIRAGAVAKEHDGPNGSIVFDSRTFQAFANNLDAIFAARLSQGAQGEAVECGGCAPPVIVARTTDHEGYPADSSVLSALIAELRKREALGRQKYGADLDRTDLSAADLRQHLREELMDALMYSHAFDHPAERAAVPDDGLYYLQDSRSYVGNCPSWWAEGRSGYTTRVDEAHRFTFDEAMRQHRERSTDIPWSCAEIDALARRTVDMQHMRSIKTQCAVLSAATTLAGKGGED